jgi:HK97 family phage major capsid protein
MDAMNPRRVGNRWVFPNGRSVAVVSGGDHTAAPTISEALADKRAQYLNDIDVILNTAKDAKRELTPQERVDHDAIVALVEGKGGLDEQIATAKATEADEARHAGQEARKAAFPTPNINVRGDYSVGANVTRDLDQMFWATADTVRAAQGTAAIPVEQVVVRAKSDNSGPGKVAPRIAAFRPQDQATIRDFQNIVAEMAVVGMMVDRDANTSAKGFRVARSLPQYAQQWKHIMAALDVDTSGEGAEWVPTGIGASLHERVRAAGKVAPLFARITLPSNPWKWPIEGGDLTAYRVAEPTSDTATKVTASTAGTVAATFDAEIFGARTLWSKSLDVDSAIAIAAYQQMKLVQAFVDAEEKAILDGDTDGTHQDTDVQAIGATDARTAWDGLRKKALAQTLVTATTTSVANLLALRGGMAKWGVNPAQLAYIVGVSALHDLIADTNLLTVDKFGPNATILNGQIGSIAGVPVIVSEHVREDLNATGVNDGITATKTYNLCVNRGEFAIGQRMALDVETNDVLYGETFQRVAYAFMREDFQHIGSAATNDDVAMSYNVTP